MNNNNWSYSSSEKMHEYMSQHILSLKAHDNKRNTRVVGHHVVTQTEVMLRLDCLILQPFLVAYTDFDVCCLCGLRSR